MRSGAEQTQRLGTNDPNAVGFLCPLRAYQTEPGDVHNGMIADSERLLLAHRCVVWALHLQQRYVLHRNLMQ